MIPRNWITCVTILVLSFTTGWLRAQADEITTAMDIVYSSGSGYELRLDISYPTMRTTPRPGIIFVHGSWESSSKIAYLAATEYAAKLGYVSVTIDHRPIHAKVEGRQKYPFPAQVCDVKNAVRWLRANAGTYNLDVTRIGAVGFSSGAYLVLMAGLATDDKIPCFSDENTGIPSSLQAIVNLSGITDVVDKYNASMPFMMVDLLGGTPQERPELYREASPVNHVGPDSPPILTIHGTLDPYIPIREARLLDKKMHEAGREHTLIVIENGPHVDVWPDSRVWRFLAEALHPER